MELLLTAFAVASLVSTTTLKNLRDWQRSNRSAKH